MDFSKVTEWVIPEGNVIRVTETETGRILWEKPASEINIAYFDGLD